MIREIYLVGRRPWIGFAAAGLRNRVHSLSLWTRFPAPLPASGASLVRNPSVEVPRPDAYCRHPPLLTFCTSIAVTCTFLRAGRLLQRGVAQAEVARRVGVTRTTVSQWNAQLEAGGMEALNSRPRGRPSGLAEAQRRELMSALTRGALAEGFPTDLWTLPRVGQLIERGFGRSYSESQVWRILVSLGFSCQRPSGRALERDEAAIKRWKQTRWPALKKTLQNKDGSSSSSTSRD
jgi:transposase